ncbi:hypothetical protein PoB_005221300 [Plakobranchus ocellatus]|uniref:Secreted protein n=1 Tax=Plakobranchus ocellatus TaxID=259542 RepID=A0AAV4C3Z5_9GAST|nr:hypothetical protein PoB_005221300 [Plakobranchus ocellatus]
MRLRDLQAIMTLFHISRVVSVMLMTGHAKCEPFSLPTVECWDRRIRIHEQERTLTYAADHNATGAPHGTGPSWFSCIYVGAL